MKYLTIILLVVLSSCNLKTKQEVKTSDEIQAMEVVEVIQKTINTTPKTESKTEFELVTTVLKKLNIEKEKCKIDLVVMKKTPNNRDETIIAIPEIVKESEQYFELNSHILIVETTTGKIKQHYFESYETNGWVSDAIRLTELKIDTAPYMVSENKRAFGIRVYFYGSSQVNPYSNEKISLYVKTEKSLQKIVNNLNVMTYGGEWNTDCEGEFSGENKVLIMSEEKTNGYFNILVKSKITETKNYLNENNDCDAKEKVTRVNKVLAFVNGVYK